MADAISNATSPSSRACRNCSTAKAKCVATLQNNNLICARCIRLQLNCEAQAPRIRKRREPKAIRMGRLENKLDSVLTLLKSSPSSGLPAISTQLNILSPTSSPQISSVSTSSVEVSDSRVHGARATSLRPLGSAAIDGSASPRRQSFSESAALSDDEENALNTFRTHMLSYFPFVILGGINPAILRTQKPFLLATIVLGASRQKVTRQKSAARSLLQSFSERCLIDGRTSLDLLQAILVYIQWCNCHFINNPQISILIQLAVTLVAELGLNKKPRPRLTRQQQVLVDATPQSSEDLAASKFHSLEEMRAFLGCFYLSSIISASFKRVEAMAYTAYIEDCCAVLEQHNEFSTDICLVKLVRTQVVGRKLAQSLPSDDLQPLWSSMTPIGMVVKALEAELEKISTLDIQTKVPFLLHYHGVRISLYEVGLRKPHHALAHLNFPHLELRYSCLVSVKAYFDAYFSIPTDLYFALPSVIWIQLADIIAVLARLLLISTDGWDLAHARSVVNLAAVFEHLEENFVGASTAARKARAPDDDEEEDMFRGYAVAMRRGRAAYENKLASQLEGSKQVADVFSRSNSAVPSDFAWDENIFWQEALVDWGDFEHTGMGGTWI